VAQKFVKFKEEFLTPDIGDKLVAMRICSGAQKIGINSNLKLNEVIPICPYLSTVIQWLSTE
jgi:hypothetical protein